MVLLTIVTNSNPHTLYFDHPIEKKSQATSGFYLHLCTIRGII